MTQSIFKKIFYRIFSIFIILSIGLGTILTIQLRQILLHEYTSKGQGLAQSIASAAAMDLMTMDISIYQDTLNQYNTISGVAYIYLTDDNNHMLIHTFTPNPPTDVLLSDKPPPLKRHIPTLNVLELNAPILYGSLGHVFVGMDLTIINNYLISILLKAFVILITLISACLFVLHISIRAITKPLKTLSKFSTSLSVNQFDISKTDQSQIKSLCKLNDEIGSFSTDYLKLYQQLDDHIQQLTKATAKQAAIEKELAIAHDIQMNLLTTPTITLSSTMDVAAYLQPAQTIGGDFYDVIEHNNLVYITVGDVSGKGTAAALVMAATLTSIRAAIQSYKTPIDIISHVNQQISQHNPNMMFVTCFFAAIDPYSGHMDYINAGHPSPILFSNSTCQPLASTNGSVMGIDPHQFYPSSSIGLPNHSFLVAYSDGLTEAHNHNNELLGISAIHQALSKTPPSTANDCNAIILESLASFVGDTPPHDDITLLSLSFQASFHPISNPLNISFNNDIQELNKLQQVTTIFSTHYGINKTNENQLNLMLEELLSNTIYYGYTDHKEHTILVSFYHEPSSITLIIEDDGIPFNPLTTPTTSHQSSNIDDQPIGGLGIQIIKKMARHIDYVREGNKNKITIIKDIT